MWKMIYEKKFLMINVDTLDKPDSWAIVWIFHGNIQYNRGAGGVIFWTSITGSKIIGTQINAESCSKFLDKMFLSGIDCKEEALI